MTPHERRAAAGRRDDELTDGEIVLVLAQEIAPNSLRGIVQAYDFDIVLAEVRASVGTIILRVGHTKLLENYSGHIGYFVDESARGHRFAEKACRLILQFAKRAGMSHVIITCNPDNWASRITCERLGADLIGIVDLPASTDLYQRGDRQKCRYRIVL